MPLTVRLSAATERRLDALARRRKQSKSDVVRDALDHYASVHADQDDDASPYRAWAGVIGLVDLGSRRKAKETTGEAFTALVREKARARRAR
jgi:Arc/MetJ-type ribon-helix-helix transcriptional regulator